MDALLLALALVLPQALPSQAAATQPPAAADLCIRIAKMTQTPDVARAHWGFSVAAPDGSPVCSLNATQLFRPASINKIFTSAAALALLGPDRTFSTRVAVNGVLSRGTLRGNLRLTGGGDANFGTQDVPYLPPAERPSIEEPELKTIPDIESLADQIVAHGVRKITGNVLGDDSYFAWQPYPPEWSAGDLMYGYGAPVSALSIHDNEVAIRVGRSESDLPIGKAGTVEKTAMEAIPSVPWFTLENDVALGNVKGSCDSGLDFARQPGSRVVKVVGQIPPSAKDCGETLAIEDPAEYAALALKLALEQRGVRISGRAKAHHWNPQLPGGVLTGENDDDPALQANFNQPRPLPVVCPEVPSGTPQITPTGAVLAIHTSPPLLADEIVTLKTSQNLHAEVLLRNLGAAYSCDHTERGSLHVLRQYLLHAGVDPGDFVLYDGSGLSSHDLVAPRALTTFLSFAAQQPWFSAWRTTLPVSGVDGTLHARFKDELKGRVFAKTGTLGESRTLAGYVLTDSGKLRSFAIMVDNHTPLSSADRGVMDRMVEAIAEDTAAP